jgi:opacity protein-like surface antigen
MSRVSLLAAAAALTLAATPPLHAADLLPPLPSMHEPIVEKQQIGEGWYLRGDVGYGATRLGRATPSPDRGAFTNAKLREGGTLGAGAGYRFNEHLRFDLTIDHRFSARFTAADALLPGFAELHDRANFSATTGLVNAYVDLGNWNGITPYIGGGIGMSNKRMSDYVVDVCAPTCDVARAEFRRLPDRSRNDLAWALMAGVGVDVGGGATLDLGYRYLNLGKAQSGVDPLVGGTRLSRIESHEIRAGLRWHFASSSRGW